MQTGPPGVDMLESLVQIQQQQRQERQLSTAPASGSTEGRIATAASAFDTQRATGARSSALVAAAGRSFYEAPSLLSPGDFSRQRRASYNT